MKKTDLARALVWSGRFPVKTVADTLEVAMSNLICEPKAVKVAPQGVRSDPSVLDRAHCPYVAIYKEQRHYGRIAYQDGDDLKTSLWIPEFQKLPTQVDCTVRVEWSIRDQKLIRCKIDMPHAMGKSRRA